MNQDPQFTSKLQAWVNTPDSQKDWDEGALLLLQLSGNRIMYHNISINPKGKAEFIKGQLQKYLNFRLQKLTRDQVCQMQSEVDEIVKKVIKPAADSSTADAGKSEEFADFKAGKRSDHDDLPAEIQALYVENLDIVHRMRELHLKLRTLSLENATCPDSERYPFLKEIISLDKRLHANWDAYDHYVVGDTPLDTTEKTEDETDEKGDNEESEQSQETSEDIAAESETSPEAPKEVKPKKTAGRKPKTAKK